MPRRFQMLDLYTRSIRRANMENDLSVSKPEAYALIGEVYGTMYGFVCGVGTRYFETSSNWFPSGLSYISEPADHLSTVDTIERQVDAAGHVRRLKPLMAQERSRWAGRTGHGRRWEMVDDRINIYPTPPAGYPYPYILRYIPQPPDLATYGDTDVVDVVNPDGLAYVVWGTGVLLLAKSKSDVVLCMTERDAAEKRLRAWALERLKNEPRRMIVDDDDDDDGPWLDGDWRYDR